MAPFLTDVLLRLSTDVPNRVALRFPAARGQVELTLSFAELHARAAHVAGGLLARVDRGDRVLLALAEPAEFVPVLLGCLYAGLVAVSTPLGDRTISAVAAHQSEGIAQDATPRLGVTASPALLAGDAPDYPALSKLTWVTAGDLSAGSPGPADPQPRVSGPALLQYTSGSTSAPKGVLVTHANIVDQASRIQRAFHLGWDSVLASWLPLYHDMGLVATVLAPIYAGCEAVLSPPRDFIRDPLSWLRLITQHRGTVCGAPNFAYELCARRATPDAVAELDLRSWRLAWNGAEPILAGTLDRFAEAFAPAGFQRDSFYPCFGMAETTLMVTGRQAPVVRNFSRDALETGHAREPRAGERLIALVSSGRADHGQQVSIVDPAERLQCPPGTVGELWISGPSVAAGYWQQPALSEETFAARLADPGPTTGFLRTGDAGFIRDGELFISGRLKDLIIIRGRNIFPQDLELTAESSHAALRPGRGVAFGITDEDGIEEIVLVLETRAEAGDVAEVPRQVRDAVAVDHGLVASSVVLVPGGSLEKTSSGKVRRGACRAAYLAGALPILVEDRVRVAR